VDPLVLGLVLRAQHRRRQVLARALQLHLRPIILRQLTQSFYVKKIVLLRRVVRWFIFKQKIPIWVNIGGPYVDGKMLIYFLAIGNI
jgi:hypothetical protein